MATFTSSTTVKSGSGSVERVQANVDASLALESLKSMDDKINAARANLAELLESVK